MEETVERPVAVSQQQDEDEDEGLDMSSFPPIPNIPVGEKETFIPTPKKPVGEKETFISTPKKPVEAPVQKQKTNPPHPTPPPQPKEIVITPQIYRSVSLMKAENRCSVCGFSVEPAVQNVVQLSCSCKRAFKYHLDCVQKSRIWELKGLETCLDCWTSEAAEKLEGERKAMIARKKTEVSEPASDDVRCAVLAMLGYEKYQKGYPIINLFQKIDMSTFNTDWLCIDKSTIISSGLTYEDFANVGFTLNHMVQCFGLTMTDLAQSLKFFDSDKGFEDLIAFPTAAVEAKISPIAMRLKKVPLEKIAAQDPRIDDLIILGFNSAELMMSGFKKESFRMFTHIGIGEWIKKMKFDSKTFQMMRLHPDDFEPKGVMSGINRKILVSQLGVEPHEACALGIYYVQEEKKKYDRYGVPTLE